MKANDKRTVELLQQQLASERLQREYADKMHAKELEKLKDQFEQRERHALKKYKKLKRKFQKALLIIENL